MKLFEASTQDGSTSLRFEWFDDEWGSIKEHRISVREEESEEVFSFGACARFGHRRVLSFFRDNKVGEASLGFRNPQIICYTLGRDESGCVSLSVEDSARAERLHYSLGSDFRISDSELE